MPKRRVVITGLGVVTPLGEDLETVWTRLLEGHSGIKAVSRIVGIENYPVRIGGEITPADFDPLKTLEHKAIKRLDLFSVYGLVAGIKAVRDSGLDFTKENPHRAGVIVGSGIGGIATMEEEYDVLNAKGVRRVSPFTVPKLMVNAAAGNISIQFGLKGPVSATATACATAGNAVIDAYKTIQYEDADIMVAGGSEAALTKLGLASFCALRALSPRNDEPTKASRPFEKNRNGFVMSEGAGVVVLEEYEHARARGARIYAELIGVGATGDGCHITAPDENGAGAAAAMAKAIHEAKINPEQIGYINAHGTSTELGDLAETKAVKTVFGAAAKKVAISSTKSALGHSLGASGGIELVLTALALTRGHLPPTINYDEPDPECDLDYVPNIARRATVQYAMSNSFGFGGHNTSLLIGKV
ncbi:MAG TPA: beta-ketoacyl-ACP synthase II [Phycisphaerae bacterium]|nr:beta-ketoacyl-ACP synthase II [Phycisphaerae bacterium]